MVFIDVDGQKHTAAANAFLVRVAVLVGEKRVLDRAPQARLSLRGVADLVVASARLVVNADMVGIDVCRLQALLGSFGIGTVVEQSGDGTGHDSLSW